MAKWFKFSSDYDHRWPSRAITAFKAGMIVHVKDEVAEGAKAAKAGSETTKPKDGAEGYESSGRKQETDAPKQSGVATVKTGGFTGNPDRLNSGAEGGELPDASDPKATRSEVLVEVDGPKTEGEAPKLVDTPTKPGPDAADDTMMSDA